MANNIEIVIKGVDEFSDTFSALDAAFGSISKSGGDAGESISGMAERFSSLSESVGEAGKAASDFTKELGDNLSTITETQQETLGEMALQQEESAITMGETLLETDAEFQERRAGQTEHALANLSQIYQNFSESLKARLTILMTSLESIELSSLADRLANFRTFYDSLLALSGSKSRDMAKVSKYLAVSEALIRTYQAANNALAQFPYPYNFAVAATVTAQGLANVQRIRQINVAHGGLENVPEDSTFLLKSGERVISPNQNRDLTTFLNQEKTDGGGGDVVVQNMTFHLFENATSGDSLLSMESSDIRQVVAEKIIPALDELARMGIRPNFVENNT